MDAKLMLPLYLAGIFNLGLFVFHLFFWKLFKWPEQLRRVSRLNANVMQIMNLCLMAVFLFSAYLSFFHVEALTSSPLGQSVLAGFAIFWFLRAIEQVWFFKLKTAVSTAFTALFTLGGTLYAVPLFMSS